MEFAAKRGSERRAEANIVLLESRYAVLQRMESKETNPRHFSGKRRAWTMMKRIRCRISWL